MRRRTYLRRIGTGGALAVGGVGLASADEEVHVTWEFADGRVERIPATEFDRRSDTPSLAELDVDASSPPCCGPILDPNEVLCVEC